MMLRKLFQRLCAQRRLAVIFILGSTLTYLAASALQQAALDILPLRIVAIVLMLLGVLGQLLGLAAFMQGGKR